MADPTATYNLPGVQFSINDGGLRVAAPLPGPKLTLYATTTATAYAAKLHEPFTVESAPKAISALRNADGTDSEASLAIEEAVEAGAKNIEIVLIASTSEFATENDRWDALAASFKRTRDWPMDHVVARNALADTEGLSGTDPDGETRTTFWNQLGNFCYRATKIGNSVRGYIGITPLLQLARAEAWTSAPTSEGGELFEYPTLAQLDEYLAHIKSETGDLDDHSTHVAMVGYVAGSIETSPGTISSGYTGWARETTGSIAVDDYGTNVDGQRAVTVCAFVARQFLPSTKSRAAKAGYGGETSQNTNGVVAFAALCTGLPATKTPTNKPVPSLEAPRMIPLEFAEELLNLRIVSGVTRGNLGLVVNKGMTGAYNGGPYTKSDFTNWSTYNLVIVALDICRERAFPYIGQMGSPELILALEKDLTDALDVLVKWGLASKVKPQIIQTRDDNILGNLDVELNITPNGEIDNIKFRSLLSR